MKAKKTFGEIRPSDKWIWIAIIVVVGVTVILMWFPSDSQKEADLSEEVVIDENEEETYVSFSPSGSDETIEEFPEEAILQKEESYDSEEPIEEARKVVASESQVKEKQFAIQVFAFRSERKAQSARKKLEEEGYPSYTISESLDEGYIYRVRVGGFSTKDEARQLLKQIKKGYPDSFIALRD